MGHGETTRLQDWVTRLKGGDPTAADELLRHFEKRLQHLAGKMHRSFRIGEETDDVLQEATLRLLKALRKVDLNSTQHFFRLAATQIRRELLDLAKRDRNHHPVISLDLADSRDPAIADLHASSSEGPDRLAAWAEFHRKVEALDDSLREVFGLSYYGNLTQREIGELIGVSKRTVSERYIKATLELRRAYPSGLPDM